MRTRSAGPSLRFHRGREQRIAKDVYVGSANPHGREHPGLVSSARVLGIQTILFELSDIDNRLAVGEFHSEVSVTDRSRRGAPVRRVHSRIPGLILDSAWIMVRLWQPG